MTDPLTLNRIIRQIVREDVERSEARFGSGVVAVVEGQYASIRKGDPAAVPTPGFFVSPELAIVEGDHAMYYDDGGFKAVIKIMNRNAIGLVAGTWSPWITFAVPGNLAVAYSEQTGNWRRLGDLVHWGARITTTAFTHTTASGALQVVGLPFVAATDAAATAVLSGWTKAGRTQIIAAVRTDTDYMEFHASGSGVSYVLLEAADLPSGGTIVLRANGYYLAGE